MYDNENKHLPYMYTSAPRQTAAARFDLHRRSQSYLGVDVTRNWNVNNAWDEWPALSPVAQLPRHDGRFSFRLGSRHGLGLRLQSPRCPNPAAAELTVSMARTMNLRSLASIKNGAEKMIVWDAGQDPTWNYSTYHMASMSMDGWMISWGGGPAFLDPPRDEHPYRL